MFIHKNKLNKGFTLIELLIIISCIGMLAGSIFVATDSAREKARVVRAVADMRQIFTAVNIYYNDTGQLPPNCNWACTAVNDPFLNSLGISGWSGPYLTLYDKSHPWKGHLSVESDDDFTGDSQNDCEIILNDDRPMTDGADNQGVIPVSSMLAIDKIMDDGNLGTGNIQGNGQGFNTALGEITFLCSR